MTLLGELRALGQAILQEFKEIRKVLEEIRDQGRPKPQKPDRSSVSAKS